MSKKLAPELDEETKFNQVKFLKNFKWNNEGYKKSCLDYYNINISQAWLMGVEAFIVNIKDDVEPAGADRWNDGTSGKLNKLLNNIGINLTTVIGYKAWSNFKDSQLKAYNLVKHAINNNITCFGWNLDKYEFYIINGYDEHGYYYSGPNQEDITGPKLWDEIAINDAGWLEISTLEYGNKIADIIHIKETFEFLLEHATSPTNWLNKGFKFGDEAWINWIEAFKNSNTTYRGVSANAVIWKKEES